MITSIFILLLVFQAKHFLADFPLQGWPWTPWMLGKFRDEGWELPLAGHAGVHAAFTFLIVLAWQPAMWSLCVLLPVVDFVVHLTMDRIKADSQLLGRWKSLCRHDVAVGQPVTEAQWRTNAFFWWSLGLDQAIHHLTHYGIIYALVTS
jgi:hypothetical protein